MSAGILFRARGSRRALALAGAAALLALSTGARAEPASAPAEPRARSLPYYVDGFDQTVRPFSRAFDLALGVRKLTGRKREAANVDERDQVRLPSTWWTPRVGYRPVTAAQMLAGPGDDAGPAPGTWTVVHAKSQGVSPGIQIVDAQGRRFAIKFDPPDVPELTTGAEVVASHLYWAAGYNVPHNVIVQFRREDLEIGPRATYRDPLRGTMPMTGAYLDRLLAQVARRPDGSYRAVASLFLAGKPLGEMDYEGRRRDDPEDLIPHQLRRELRGAWAINAWLHHDDCSSRNTLDLWVTENGRSFVRHYFIDFNGALGAASITRHSYRSGHEYLLDYGVAAKNVVTLGLDPPPWERAVDPGIPGLGFIDAETFDPGSWRPFLPNAAFDERTERDIRWGARIVAGFGEELIRAAVQQGKYSDPRAAEALVRVLLARRDRIVQRWLPESTATADRPASEP